MTTRTRPAVDYGPELLTVTIATSDNSIARCLIGAFDATVNWCPNHKTATIRVERIGTDTIGMIASFGRVAFTSITR